MIASSLFCRNTLRTSFLLFSGTIYCCFVVGAAAEASLTFPLFRMTASKLQLMGHNIAATPFVTMFVLILTTGGIDSSSTFAWMLTAPIVAVLLCGKGAGQFWSGVVIAGSLGILGAQWSGVLLPMLYDSSLRFPLIMVGFPGAVAIVYLFTSLLETSKDRALASAAKAKASVQESLERSQNLASEVEHEKQNVETCPPKRGRAHISCLNIEQMLKELNVLPPAT